MESLANQFLIAMPGMADPNFARSVTFICQHDDSGALGIVINRPADLRLGEMLRQLNFPAAAAVAHQPVYNGGPVHGERGFVLHEDIGQWESTLPVSEDLALTTSQDILRAVGEGRGPRRFLVALGYAGWGGGQLEREITANAWLNGPADPDVIFDAPLETRWAAAARLLGVDLGRVSSEAGHA